jgi:hypothetical protein
MAMFSHQSKSDFYAVLICLCCLTSSVKTQTQTGKSLTGYNAIVVEAVTLDKNPKLAKFPAGHDTDFQKKIVADLQRKNVFAEVVDGTMQAGGQEPGAKIPAGARRLILSTTIVDFNPGNKALRYTVGMGLGATRVKARFVFRDAATGQEVLMSAQQGRFLGFVTLHGTGKDYPVTEASGDIVDGLIRTINKNR